MLPQQVGIVVLLTCVLVRCSGAFSFISFGARSSLLRIDASARPAIDWIKSEPLENLLSKDDALAICNEILSSDSLIDDSEALVTRNWEKVEQKLKNETRSTREIIGEETTERILRSVRNVEGYDPDAVRAFLGSDAINDLFAKILYDGIYQFFQTIDVFGNIISNLPIIGPIRNQIRDEMKRNLDRTLGPLVQSFLREYTKVAVLEASDFVMSPANRKAFGAANVRLVSSILERPLNSLVPPSDMTVKLREDAFEYIRNIDVEDLDEYAKFVYDFVGDKSVEDVLDVDRVLDASPTLQKTIDDLWDKAVSAGSK